MHWIAILRKDGEHVALAELERQAADIDVGSISIVRMPGCVRGDALLQLDIIEAGHLTDGLHFRLLEVQCICAGYLVTFIAA